MSKKKSQKDTSDMKIDGGNSDNDDFSIDFDEAPESTNPVTGSDVEKKIKKLKKDLSECQNLKQEYLDGWQRVKADFVNLKKRSEEDKKAFAKYANEGFILELLPVLDSFDQAFKNKEAWEKADENWRKGIEFIYSQLVSILNNHGVKEMNPTGEKFNPELHHSIEMVEVEEKKDDGKIVDVTQKGYTLGDKIIRHASVRVGEIRK